MQVIGLPKIVSVRSMRQLLQLVSEGRTNAEIGEHFGVKHATIEKDLQIIYAALDCKSGSSSTRRCEALGHAFRKGILH